MGAMVGRKGEREGDTDGGREKERRKVQENERGASKINRTIDEVSERERKNVENRVRNGKGEEREREREKGFRALRG